MNKNKKYTKEVLEPIVKSSKTISEILEKLGVSKINGGNNAYMSKVLKRLDISTEHFLGSAWNKSRGRNRIGGNKYKEPEQILILREEGSHREHAHYLRRAMKEKGIDEKCTICNMDKWNGENIRLEVDHINGNAMDNRLENLRFICPNCHSQTKNFRNYNLKQIK